MANQKLSELTELATTPASGDQVYIQDVSEGVPANQSKRITIANLVGLPDASTIENSAGTLRVKDDGVTNAKLANMAQSTVKGRAAGAGTGDPTDLTATQATAILDNFVGDSGSGGTKGLVPAPSAGDTAAGKFLKADGTFAIPPSGGDAILYDNTISGSDTTWDVSSISQAYTHLRIVVHTRSDVSNTQDYLKLTLNNDTTDANYRQADHYGGSAHAVTVANKRYVGFIPGSTSTANIFNTLIINIPFYTNGHLKMVLSQGFQADDLTGVYVIQFGYIWNNTGAINRVALAPNTGTNLKIDSRLMIYGVL